MFFKVLKALLVILAILVSFLTVSIIGGTLMTGTLPQFLEGHIQVPEPEK